jgi:hypothetical protein
MTVRIMPSSRKWPQPAKPRLRVPDSAAIAAAGRDDLLTAKKPHSGSDPLIRADPKGGPGAGRLVL